MEIGDGIFSSLSTSSFGTNDSSQKILELEEKNAALETLLREVQTEMLGSIEALNRKIVEMEVRIHDLQEMAWRQPQQTQTYNSAFDLMTPEELGMGHVDDVVMEDDPDVIVVKSGFTAPPPVEVVDLPEEVPEIEEIEDLTPEVVEDVRGEVEEWVDAIESHINEHGGVVSQDFKRLGLIPEDITSSERSRLNDELADCFTKHKVNNFRIFYCSPLIMEPDEVKAQYTKVYPKKS